MKTVRSCSLLLLLSCIPLWAARLPRAIPNVSELPSLLEGSVIPVHAGSVTLLFAATETPEVTLTRNGTTETGSVKKVADGIWQAETRVPSPAVGAPTPDMQLDVSPKSGAGFTPVHIAKTYPGEVLVLALPRTWKDTQARVLKPAAHAGTGSWHVGSGDITRSKVSWSDLPDSPSASTFPAAIVHAWLSTQKIPLPVDDHPIGVLLAYSDALWIDPAAEPSDTAPDLWPHNRGLMVFMGTVVAPPTVVVWQCGNNESNRQTWDRILDPFAERNEDSANFLDVISKALQQRVSDFNREFSWIDLPCYIAVPPWTSSFDDTYRRRGAQTVQNALAKGSDSTDAVARYQYVVPNELDTKVINAAVTAPSAAPAGVLAYMIGAAAAAAQP